MTAEVLDDDPERVARYLRWWATRPARWLSNLTEDFAEYELPNDSDAPLFSADAGAHEVAVERGFLVPDPRPDTEGWELTDAGLAFFGEHYEVHAREPAQLGLFG